MKHYKSGHIINNLKILFETEKDKFGRRQYQCECLLCGSLVDVKATYITTGKKTSCGCDTRQKISKAKTKHGHKKENSKAYRTWLSIKTRCYNPKYHSYNRYGGRGIKVSDEWINSFENFLRDMGEPPTPKHQIDRINNDGNYTKGNCRWVTPKENSENRKVLKNPTGYTGVSYKKHLNKYQSYFFVKRKSKYVGVFDTPKEAYEARIKAIKKYNSEVSEDEQIKFLELEDMVNAL